jgi:hypothetical protein
VFGTSDRQEVATVEILAMTQTPLALRAACAPVGARAPRIASVPRVHQVFSQAELAVALVRSSENYGVNELAVDGIRLGGKTKSVQVASGVPPRGRPV